MSTLKTIVFTVVILGVILSSLVYYLVYVKQERVMFFPEKLPADYKFQFEQDFEEIFIEANDGIKLNGLLFKADSATGLIFYLHGNGGSVRSWGGISSFYTELGYDLFILDYRGYGKSEGSIKSEKQFYSDIQAAYDMLNVRYLDKKLVILGYSIGTGPAAWLASGNTPDLLVLQAPYYNTQDLKDQWYPFVPDVLVKYKFETHRFLANVKAPVVVFHGTRDEVISYQSAIKLKSHFKDGDVLIQLKNQTHTGMSFNPEYRAGLQYHLQTIAKQSRIP